MRRVSRIYVNDDPGRRIGTAAIAHGQVSGTRHTYGQFGLVANLVRDRIARLKGHAIAHGFAAQAANALDLGLADPVPGNITTETVDLADSRHTGIAVAVELVTYVTLVVCTSWILFTCGAADRSYHVDTTLVPTFGFTALATDRFDLLHAQLIPSTSFARLSALGLYGVGAHWIPMRRTSPATAFGLIRNQIGALLSPGAVTGLGSAHLVNQVDAPLSPTVITGFGTAERIEFANRGHARIAFGIEPRAGHTRAVAAAGVARVLEGTDRTATSRVLRADGFDAGIAAIIERRPKGASGMLTARIETRHTTLGG